MSQPADARRRRHPVRAALLGWLLLEIVLFMLLGQAIGYWPTVLLLLALSAVGAFVVRHEGAKAWRSLSDAASSGRVPTGVGGDSALVLVGGVLMLVPGFFSALVGLCFVLPPTRPLGRLAFARLLGWGALSVVTTRYTVRGTGGDVVQGEVVQGEVVDGPGEDAPRRALPEESGDDEAGRTS